MSCQRDVQDQMNDAQCGAPAVYLALENMNSTIELMISFAPASRKSRMPISLTAVRVIPM
jgi:hypothetical protein